VRMLLIVAALFAAIFAARLTTGELGNGTTFLYVLPVVIVAIEFGRWAGLVAGMLALALFAVWAQMQDPQVGVVAYAKRLDGRRGGGTPFRAFRGHALHRQLRRLPHNREWDLGASARVDSGGAHVAAVPRARPP
jgi:hypothetical protein